MRAMSGLRYPDRAAFFAPQRDGYRLFRKVMQMKSVFDAEATSAVCAVAISGSRVRFGQTDTLVQFAARTNSGEPPV